MIGKYVVVRCDRAGVFAGILKERSGREVTLVDCRRLYYWDGACSCSQLAADGVKKPNNCRFTITLDEIVLLEAIEIIPTTPEAEQSLRGVSEWKR